MALVVITGGARSGKSSVAERLARERGPVTLVVFGEPCDDEMEARLRHHRVARPDEWTVLEPAAERDASGEAGWLGAVPPAETLLVDCIGTALGRLMRSAHEQLGLGELTDAGAHLPVEFENLVQQRLDSLLDAIVAREGDTVVVTNEVGDGVVPAYASGRVFRDLLGRANRRLVDAADRAYLAVAGRLVELTALPSQPTWPDEDA